METLKKYLPPLIIGVLMLMPAPFFMFVIFLSGDSCCGENTSSQMTIVTLIIVGLMGIGALLANFVCKLIFRSKNLTYNILIGSFISWMISSGFYFLYLLSIIATAF